MKICFVSDAGSSHTKKWCNWFMSRGHEVSVISFTSGNIDNVNVYCLDTNVDVEGSDFKKIGYLLYARKIKRILGDIQPDIVNVHYATSYGATMALSGYKNYILSVWGADVYDFPKKSVLHKWMLKFSLSRAKYIFSTSHAMALETQKYTDKKIEVTPFGVDTQLFNPDKRAYNREEQDKKFVVGTVKTLIPKYGIDYLIQALAIIKERKPEIPILLRIAGKGSYEREYKELANTLGVNEYISWLGFISQEEAAKEWASMDLGIVYSTLDSESFGVSAVECQACETPIIISDLPGLMEATIPEKTSIVIERKNAKKLADMICELYYDVDRRTELGRLGRDYVERKYGLNQCFLDIEKIFFDIMNNKH